MPETTQPQSVQVKTHESPNGWHAPGAAPAPAGAHDMQAGLPRISRGALAAIGVVLGVLFVGMFLLGWIPHQRRLALARAEAERAGDTKPVVELVVPREAPAEAEILLPGDVRANQVTSMFARTNGYLKPLPAGIDIGAGVRAGQRIAEIATPEVDAQLEQARAALGQARAAVKRATEEHELAVTTLQRYESLSGTKAVSEQDVDARRAQESVSAAAVKEAESNVGVAEAAVKRFEELQQFQTVVAPFAGVITARGYDAGALITSGETDASKALFVVEQVDVLRVGVNVPQGYATDVRVGQAAELLVSNFPGRVFAGRVARTAGAIDAGTRTLRVEVDVPNTDGALLPGMYGQVRFQVQRERAVLMVPTSALMFGAGGMTVAVVGDGRVRMRGVVLGRDFGVEAEVVSGLEKGDAVVKNPGGLEEGAEVTIKKDPRRSTPEKHGG